VSPKLVTIRGLLAKAEATEFPAEVGAFTAKAQALIIEARLDEATVRASSGRRSTGRVSAIRHPHRHRRALHRVEAVVAARHCDGE
jgi:hypothetical protein